MRGAHGEHVVHGCDAGRVEAERLVERRRVLRSRKEGVRCGARYTGRPDSRLWARARAERTWNIQPMFMTLDVSKLSGWLNAFAVCRVERRAWKVERG